MKKQFNLIIIILIMLLALSACGFGTTDSPEEELDSMYTHSLEDSEEDLKDFEAEAGNINGQEAADLANEVNHFRYDVDQNLKKADDDLKSGALTQEEHDEIVSKLNDLKDRASTLFNDLKTKAGDAASSIREDASVATERFEDQDELEHFIDDTEDYLKTVESSIPYMSGESIAHNKDLVTSLDKHIDNARAQLDDLLSRKVIDEEHYKTFSDELSELKTTSSNVLKEIDDNQ